MDFERIKGTLYVAYTNFFCVSTKATESYAIVRIVLTRFYTFLSVCTLMHIVYGLRNSTSRRLSSHSIHCTFGAAVFAYRISDKKNEQRICIGNIGLKFVELYVLFKLISDNKLLL